MKIPYTWDVDPKPLTRAQLSKRADNNLMSASKIRSHIFCLRVGDMARLAEPISNRRLQEIVRRAKKKWPVLADRQFHKVRDEFTIRRSK
jgi:hypothetical protein